MTNTEGVSKNFDLFISNIKEYNDKVKELIELFSKNKIKYNEIFNDDVKRGTNIINEYNKFIDKINKLQNFEIENVISNNIKSKLSKINGEEIYGKMFISAVTNKQNDKNLFDNLPIITKYKTINNNSAIQENYNNIIDIYKINRHMKKNLFAFNFILSYMQKNDIQKDKNIIRKYYKGTLIINNVIETPEVKAFITIPDNEILGFENKTIGPEFEIEFKYDDNNIYIMFKHTKIFRFDVNKNNELVDMFSDGFYKTKEILYNIDLAFYPVDEITYIETVEDSSEFENGKEILNSKITLKPIKEGFYKYINFNTDSKNVINKNTSRKYLFNSHELDKSENIEKNEYFDINKFVDFIENEFSREVEKYKSQINEYEYDLKINDSYLDEDKIIFATNKGLFIYLLEDNNYLNISKKWMNSHNDKLININYRCIGKNSVGNYYTYTDESGLINLGKNIFKYIDGNIPMDIKNIPSNNILDILLADNSFPNEYTNIIDIKIKNDLIYSYYIHKEEGYRLNYRLYLKILDFNLKCVYKKNVFNSSNIDEYTYDSIAFNKNTYFFTNIDLKGFLKENKLLFKRNENNIVIFENCFINNNIINYNDENPKILNIDFNQYNFSINSSFYFDEIDDKIYCIFEDNERKIKSIEIIKNNEQYIPANEAVKISDSSIFKTIDNLYFKKDDISIVNNVGIIKTKKNKIVKVDNIENIRNKINKILNKEIENNNFNENVNIFYKILIYAKNKVDYSDSFDSLYKEIGIINRKNKDYEIIKTDIGTFLKEKDRDDIYYWASNRDNYEKLGNKKDRYENIRFEYTDKIPKHKIEYLELDKIKRRAALPLADIPTSSSYKNGTNTSTPFYNNTYGIKIVSIKKRCTKMSFYYKTYTNNNNYIYLYIDGIYKGNYYNTSWTQAIINDLTDEEHEFTWVLFEHSSVNCYSCIDTIAFNDEIERDSGKFSNIGNILLADIPIDSNYINGSITTTPFYNNDGGIKMISIKKQCTKMSFWYITHNGFDCGCVFFYIDGIFKGYYYDISWTQATIDNLTDEEHEFTWILYNNYGNIISACIDTIEFILKNNTIETSISDKISENIDGFITNLSYSENEIEFDYKININNVKNIITNRNKTLVMTENKLYSSFDKILSPVDKMYIPNAVCSLTSDIERTNYLKEISTYININDIKDIKLSECCIYILTNDNKLYMCGNNILSEIPNVEQNKIVHNFKKIFENVSNIWVSDDSNIIEITKNNIKEYYVSGKNNFNKYKLSNKYINNYKDEELSSIQNIKEIKIFENYIFVITTNNKIYARGQNKNNIGITDMQIISDSLKLVFENNDVSEIIDIKTNDLYSIIHCKDLNKKDVYYFSGLLDNNLKKEFIKIIFNSSNDVTKNVFIFDDNEYITYYEDDNEVMYISNSLDKNNKLEIEHPIEKVLKANKEYYLLINSNIYIYKPLNNKLIKVIDKVYDFFVFEDSMLRIIRTDMTYGTLFLDNFKFDKEYNYGAGVYIGPNIKREYIRKIKYEIESDYMEAYYGFNYKETGKDKIYSYIYDLNNNRNKRKISDFKENSDVFGIKKRRVTNTILDNLESLDSEENIKMYSVIFELLPINPSKVLTDTVFVNDIHSDNEIKIESIVK